MTPTNNERLREEFENKYDTEHGMSCPCHDGEGCKEDHKKYILEYWLSVLQEEKERWIKEVKKIIKEDISPTTISYLFKDFYDGDWVEDMGDYDKLDQRQKELVEVVKMMRGNYGSLNDCNDVIDDIISLLTQKE